MGPSFLGEELGWNETEFLFLWCPELSFSQFFPSLYINILKARLIKDQVALLHEKK